MLHDFEDADLTEWRDCGGSSWYIDPSSGHNSKFSLRSGPIDCTGISRICREVKGPAEVTFWWQCEPLRQGIAELTFTADDTRRICDSSEWSPISYTVRDNNTHQLIWEFRKIKCYPKNAGAGWIDDVCISSEKPTIPSEIKMGNVSDGNMSSDARVISSGVRVELSNFTIVANEVTMETTNVTINPSGDVLISPNEVNISPDQVSMNSPEVKISPGEIEMNNVTMNALGDVLIKPREVNMTSDRVTMNTSDIALSAEGIFLETTGNTTSFCHPCEKSINVTVESILSPVRIKPLYQDVLPSVSLISPDNSSKFFIDTQIAFRFKAVDDGKLEKCILYINREEVNSSSRINSSDDGCIITYKFNKCGHYEWHVACEDESCQSNSSDKRSISIQPDTVYVDKNQVPDRSGNWYYSDIQEAIDDAVIGTTIVVEPGTYDENIVINKPISIIGNITNSGVKPEIHGEGNIVTIASSNVNLSGLSIDALSNIRNHGIYIKNESVACSGVNISNITIRHFTKYAIYINNGSNINVMNNTIDGDRNDNLPWGLCLERGSNCNIINNDIKNVRIGIEAYNYDNLFILDNFIDYVDCGICIEPGDISNDGCNNTKNTFSPDFVNNCCHGCSVLS